jgi:hypothetical protein
LSRWATITASAVPAAIRRRNGSSSTGRQVLLTSTTPKSVLPVALPSPGKCLSTVRIPAARSSRISSVALATTTDGSAEKLRPSRPIAGLFGFTFRSTTGA